MITPRMTYRRLAWEFALALALTAAALGALLCLKP